MYKKREEGRVQEKGGGKSTREGRREECTRKGRREWNSKSLDIHPNIGSKTIYTQGDC